MTVSAPGNLYSEYVADGLATERSIGFPLRRPADLRVQANGVLQVLGQHYAVTGVSPSQRIVPLAPFWPSGATIAYWRDTAREQQYDIPAGVDLRNESLEDELDRNQLQQQEQDAEIRRAPKAPRGEEGLPMAAAADLEGKFLAVAGGKVVGLDADIPEAASQAAAAQVARIGAEAARDDAQDEADAAAASAAASQAARGGAETAQALSEAARDVATDLGNAPISGALADLPTADGTKGWAIIPYGADEGIYEDVAGSPAAWTRRADTQAVRAAASATQANALLADTTLALGKYVDADPTIQNGFFIATDGGFTANDAWRAWTLTKTASDYKLRIRALLNSPILSVVSFFDAEGDIVGAPVNLGPESGFVYYPAVEVEWPAGAVTAKGSSWAFNQTVSGSLALGGVLVERITLDDEIADGVSQSLSGRPWVRKAWSPASGYYNTNGALVTSGVDNAWQQQVFEIEAGQALRIENAVASGSVTRAIVWGSGYNSETGAFADIRGVAGAGVDGTSIPLQPDIYIAPNASRHVAVTTLGVRAVRVFITEHNPATVRANNDTINLLNPLRGKTAVWFGTSIPAGGGVTGSHVDYIGEALGLTITNEAIGGSAARGGVSARKTAGDTYGWTGINYQNLRVAMGKSLAECDDLIDNWVSKWRDLVIGDKPAASALSTEEQAVIRGSSFETILDRHLAANAKDYYIFDHGYNDWAVAFLSESSPGTTSYLYDMETVPATRFDRSTFIGAMEFYINRIWADNPKARIILMGHFARGSEDNISDGQSLLSTRTNLPLFKLWENTGWAEGFTIVGGPSDGQTAYQVWLPDGIHPFSDTTGQARDRLASLIARWLAAHA